MPTTYLDEILDVLVKTDKPMDVPQLLVALNKPAGKLLFVIDALKRGIARNLIEKIENSQAKNMYKNHFYKAVV